MQEHQQEAPCVEPGLSCVFRIPLFMFCFCLFEMRSPCAAQAGPETLGLSNLSAPAS